MAGSEYAGYSLRLDKPYFDGTNLLSGTFAVTATANPGIVFDNRATVTTFTVNVEPKKAGAECAPAVVGKTIGFWTNKNGATAQATKGGLWAKVQVAYPITATFGFGTDFTKVQAFIKGATSSDDGQSMLKAQFIATALNTQYLATGYGAQGVQVPPAAAAEALGLPSGSYVTVNAFLKAVNTNCNELDTKAERVAVKDVLDK